ncbi:MAG: FAD-dependent oxidoreductase [candidate division WOR-3 bacterium]
MSRYKKLLEPGYIGKVKTRNRIIKTGAAMNYWHKDDLKMNPKVKAFYEAFAKGGVGLLVVESPIVDYPLGGRWPQRYRLDDDRFIDGLKELVEVIHKHDCPTFLLLWHDGPWQNPLFPDVPPLYEGPPVGSYPIKLDTPLDFHRDLPRKLTISEIEEIIDKFAQAALRAKKAGFDGVEINAASSHLFHNFLSPFWNRREDDYGGSTENRARILINTIKEIKNRAGKDFAVSVIMNAIELGRAFGVQDDKCLTFEEAKKIALLLEEAGADALHVRSHWLGYHVGGFLPDYFFYPEPPVKDFPSLYYAKLHGKAANILLAAQLKKYLKIPIILVGKMDPDLGEKALREGKADFIAMNRRLLADPELPRKLAEGREDEIAPCTACGTCLDQSKGMERRCRINAAMGKEDPTIETSRDRKKVVIIGAGPAGMEAARISALRGHEVTLIEKEPKIGGLLDLAFLVKGPTPEDVLSIVKYYKTQLKRLKVNVITNKKADIELIKKLSPDVLIIAAGGKIVTPQIKGINSKIVLTSDILHKQAKKYLKIFGPRLLYLLTKIWIPIGKRVVIIGGNLQGCEIAEFLVKRGRQVTIVEEGEKIGQGVVDFRLALLLEWFNKKGVSIYNNAKVLEITNKGVIIEKNGDRLLLEADTVIPLAPMMPNEELVEIFKNFAKEIYVIGDCKEPSLIVDAIASAWETARKI